jgi:hypothetical protein
MQDLQGTADEIGSVSRRSLENQAQLLDGQSKAMEGLNSLYSFHSKALEESRYFFASHLILCQQVTNAFVICRTFIFLKKSAVFIVYLTQKETDFLSEQLQGNYGEACTVRSASAGTAAVQAGTDPRSS